MRVKRIIDILLNAYIEITLLYTLPGLKLFMDNVIAPILLKDTTFKRHFIAAPAVAVSFNLLQQIFEACYNFSSVLSAAEKENGPKVNLT